MSEGKDAGSLQGDEQLNHEGDMRTLRIDELKALLAVMIAGVFVLLSVLAIELFTIRRALERIEQELRPRAISNGRVQPQSLLNFTNGVVLAY